MKGKCRPDRRRLCARERPGHYEEELVVEILRRREERCDVRGKAGKEAAIETALSREMRQNHARKREEGIEGMKVPRIYESFVFPV